MQKNFTTYSFTPSVKELQERYNSRNAYARAETAGDRFILGASEIAFITSRDHFYLSSLAEDGWPYVQHRGGPAGFLKVVGASTLRFADYSGNRQFISSGNIAENAKTCLFLIDYANRQRLKIWAKATMSFAEDVPEWVESLADPDYPAKIERVFTLEIQAYDWNCPQHITPRYTLSEIKQSPQLKNALSLNTNLQ